MLFRYLLISLAALLFVCPLAEAQTPDKAKRLIKEAQAFYDDGRYEMASERCEQAIDIDKRNKDARRLMEKIDQARRLEDLARLREEQQAMKPVRNQLNLDATPKEKADFDAVKAYDQKGSLSTALGGYRRFIKKHPASPLVTKAQFRIAEIYDELGGSTPEERADFEQASALDQEGSGSAALAAYRRFIRNHPASPLAMKAQFRTAELYESLGDGTKAFNAYQKLVTQYPDTPDFEHAVNRQVVIANDYLAGKKVKFLGLAFLPGTDRAEEMFASIIQNAPYSKNAPIAQFNLGLTYERQNRVQEAAKAYQGVLDRYPNSSIADDAMYQIGYIYMRLGQTGKTQDLSALITAKNTFEDFLLQYPASEKAAQAKDNVVSLGSKESGDLMSIAKFYDRFKNYRAAAIYYNDIIRRAPDSADAVAARDRVQEIRSESGDEALRTGPEQAQTGETAALRRRLQAQVETSSLADFNGPPRQDIVADELPIVSSPKLRTDSRDVAPMPAVEPTLPNP